MNEQLKLSNLNKETSTGGHHKQNRAKITEGWKMELPKLSQKKGVSRFKSEKVGNKGIIGKRSDQTPPYISHARICSQLSLSHSVAIVFLLFPACSFVWGKCGWIYTSKRQAVRSYSQLQKTTSKSTDCALVQKRLVSEKITLALTICDEYRENKLYVRGIGSFLKGDEVSDSNFIYQAQYPGNVHLSTKHTLLNYFLQIGFLLSLLTCICHINWSPVSSFLLLFSYLFGVFLSVLVVLFLCFFPSPNFIWRRIKQQKGIGVSGTPLEFLALFYLTGHNLLSSV